MGSDFQHTAYIEAHIALQAARMEASIRLAEAFPDADDESLLPVIDQAMRLCHEASRLIKEMRQSHTRDKFVSELKRRCPGYPYQTYEAASGDAFVDYIR